MYDSPGTLQDTCINYICKNVEAVCEVVPQSSEETSSEQEPQAHSVVEKVLRFAFRDPDTYLHSEISEQLLTALSRHGKLDDGTMTLFTADVARLTSVHIRNVGCLSTRGLRVLRDHKIWDLEVTGLKVTVNDLIGCLGEWTLNNLRSLNVAHSTFMDGFKYCVMVALSKLRNLHALNVSCTEFNRHGLEIVAEDLVHLESLDISSTRVDDITPLRKCRDRLKSLTMYNLKVAFDEKVISVLQELRELRILDVSCEKDSNNPFEMFAPPVVSKVAEFLQSVELPHLVSLDLSGKENVGIGELLKFLTHHPNLRFLGILHSDACSEPCFTNTRDFGYRKTLKVAGTANEAQLLEALRVYVNRPLYIQKCLYNLFRLTPGYTDARVDVIMLVLPSMQLHPQQFGVQMAGSACLYNLTKGDLSQKIHPSVLRQVVDVTLTAMENFPNHFQLQKNTLLTLCSDRILQDVAFDKYRCARLVMNCLCTYDDASLDRMCVAICSILAAKISTSETSMLGAEPKYMRKLLAIVKYKVESGTVDITTKFTLSALWNLTDESPSTCQVFLDEGGMKLFLSALKTFENESAVETKVLGLINNIAEVTHLRTSLMVPEFIVILRKLLHSQHIDVSYFAAGIIAHLASDGPGAWTVTLVTRNMILEELGEVVTSWHTPEGEMVAYRSFHPFFPLLTIKDAYQVQLWAVWAIHHVCTKNAKRYFPMLVQETGNKILANLSADPMVHPSVRRICGLILDELAVERVNGML